MNDTTSTASSDTIVCSTLGYTIRDAAAMLGVVESTIEGAIRKGSLRAIELPGRMPFITATGLQSWLDSLPDWLLSAPENAWDRCAGSSATS
ncbi:helix-turn-helix domain-containing protein [Cryobacterium arcticum]|uniref:Helix-turn-helix domain-containing protein n=1 Tax=Cryobacterium arcticum TaxID=670052 RepID=A0A317ZWX4_9MICO|nr:helix-turn-helix domain-containing protein [Cryobacterium arcticum]PXA71873.1 hypothetical protein CTB96_02830 [Cryobacterium arcticum]